MRPQLAGVVPRFQSSFLCLCQAVLILLICCSSLAFAQKAGEEPAPPPVDGNASGYVARIYNDSPEEVAEALRRADQVYQSGAFPENSSPIAIVLHGPEVEIFFKEKYEEYKNIVDLAAKLSAFGVVDVRVCETQAGIMGRDRSSIHPFIGVVPFGPTEIKRLLDQQNYVYF